MVAGLALALVAGVTLWRLADHDVDGRVNEPLQVTVSGVQISGTIWVPDKDIMAVVAIVHGDGPQDRTMSGAYAPIINALLDRGIAVASWDKPGVGSSDGNWLLQSMSDRVDETRSVLRFLEKRFEGTVVGALGFSQAGWVLPSLTSADADFLILVGAAISWQDQGDYFTRVRLRREGMGEKEIETVLAEQDREDDRVFSRNSTADNAPVGMSSDRWHFIRENRNADARKPLSLLDLPLLALWGSENLNVDPNRNAAIFEEVLSRKHASTRVVVLPDATHGLLKASTYNWQLSEDWSSYSKLSFLVQGRYAYASGALDVITNWTKEVAETR